MDRHSFNSHRAVTAMLSRVLEHLRGELFGRSSDLYDCLSRAWQDPHSLNGLVSELVLEGGFGYETDARALRQHVEAGLLHDRLLRCLEEAAGEFRVHGD